MQAQNLPSTFRQSNAPVNTQEASQIRHFIGRLERKAAYLNDEIEDLQNRLYVLFKQRMDIDEKLLEYRNLVSVRRRLPAEILTMIFKHSFPEEDYPRINFQEGPLKYLHVCSDWRRIVSSAPELWTSVYVQVPDVDSDPSKGPNKTQEGYKNLLSEWVLRSKSLPISFRFEENGVYTFLSWQEAREQYAARLMRILETHASRWKDVQLIIPIDLISRNFALATPHMDLPRMNSLSIRFTNHLGVSSPINPIPTNAVHAIFQSPSLQSLTLEDVSLIRSQYSILPAIWKNITDLTLGGDNGYPTNRGLFPREALCILSYFTELESCRITLFQDNVPQAFSVRDISLPHLTLLGVKVSLLAAPTGGFEEGLATFFSALHLPQLSHFEYESRVTSTHLPPFTHLFRRPTNLHILKLFVVGISRSQLLSCLSMFPDLEELYLSSSASKELLPFLNASYQGAIPCPKLEHIGIDVDPPIPYDDFAEVCNVTSPGPRVERSAKYLLKAAEYSRRADLETRLKFLWVRARKGFLKSVDLRMCQSFRPEVISRLQPLIDDGLNVYFSEDYYSEVAGSD